MNKNLNLLNDVYISTENSSKTLNHLLPKVKNPAFRKSILSQINSFDIINKDSKTAISSLGEKYPKNKLGKLSVKISTLVCNNESAIAEYIIKESTDGMINISKNINQNSSTDPTYYSLAKKAIKAEQDSIEAAKIFL